MTQGAVLCCKSIALYIVQPHIHMHIMCTHIPRGRRLEGTARACCFSVARRRSTCPTPCSNSRTRAMAGSSSASAAAAAAEAAAAALALLPPPLPPMVAGGRSRISDDGENECAGGEEEEER